jgi:uncharacterized protein YbjT (DUF2867 family)
MADKIIAVMGATGAQGGGLVRALLQDKASGFRPRAITRDPKSDKARALAEAGAEVVGADIDDEAGLRRAFEGAAGAYCVTFFWAHFSPERELAEVGNMVRAAKAAGVGHVIWSTLEDTRKHVPLDDPRMPTLRDKYKVPHFDAKGEADKLFAEAGLPTTYQLASFYWENFISFGAGPKKGDDGTYALNLPLGDRKMAGIAAEDIGKCALGIFKRGKELVGKRVGVVGEHLTGQQMAEQMSRAIGKQIRYNAVPFDVYRNLGFPGADDLGNMFQFYHDFEQQFGQWRDVALSKELDPELQDFSTWLATNAKKIPLE